MQWKRCPKQSKMIYDPFHAKQFGIDLKSNHKEEHKFCYEWEISFKFSQAPVILN